MHASSRPRRFEMDGSDRAEGIAAAAAALAAGDLVALPTETVYGLAADATNPAAVARVFAAKGRPSFNPLIIHVPALGEAERIGVFSAAARRLAEAFWPGPLTLVVPIRSEAGIADLAVAGLSTVAVRVPAHPVAQEVLQRYGRPLAAPSANRSGHVSPTLAEHVVADLGDRVAVVLDAGPAVVGVESTIVAMLDAPTLLRSGGVGREALEGVLGHPLADPVSDDRRPQAPGMLASHYAPTVPLRLSAGSVRPDESLLAFGAALALGWERAVSVENLSPSGDLAEAAARLFAALRRLEDRGAPIAAMPVPEHGLGEAINDRLRRAAAPR